MTEARPGTGIRPGAIALVALGGIVGTAARYGFARAVPTPSGGWPWATFIVNLVGAFVLGALLEALARSDADVVDAATHPAARRHRVLRIAHDVQHVRRRDRPARARPRPRARRSPIWRSSLFAGIAVTAAGIAAAANHHRYRNGGA